MTESATFQLDEDAAERWLPAHLRPPRTAAEVIELVDAAQRRGVLTGPAPVHLARNAESWYVHVDLALRDATLRLTSPEFRSTAFPSADDAGSNSAISVLVWVVDQANALLHNLTLLIRYKVNDLLD